MAGSVKDALKTTLKLISEPRRSKEITTGGFYQLQNHLPKHRPTHTLHQNHNTATPKSPPNFPHQLVKHRPQIGISSPCLVPDDFPANPFIPDNKRMSSGRWIFAGPSGRPCREQGKHYSTRALSHTFLLRPEGASLWAGIPLLKQWQGR